MRGVSISELRNALARVLERRATEAAQQTAQQAERPAQHSVRQIVMDVVKNATDVDPNSAGMFVPAGRRLAERAQTLEDRGAESDNIWHDLMAFRGSTTGGHWATELNDAGARLQPDTASFINDHGFGNATVGQIMDHPALYDWDRGVNADRSPLSNLPVQIVPGHDSGFARNPRTYLHPRETKPRTIYRPYMRLGTDDLAKPDAIGNVLHEAQHWGQEMRFDGWPHGTSPHNHRTRATPEEDRAWYADLIKKLRNQRDVLDFHHRSSGDRVVAEQADAAEEMARRAELLSVASDGSTYEELPRFYRYLAMPGERIARWTQFRSGLNRDERRALPPRLTPDHTWRNALSQALRGSAGAGGLGLAAGATQNALERDDNG